MSALSEALKTGDEATLTQLKLFLYGWPGSGKTTLAAKAPRPLFIETDTDGHVVFRRLPANRRAEIKWYRADSWVKAVKFLTLLVKDREVLASIDTIVLDTITALQEMERDNQISGTDILTETTNPFNQNIYAKNNKRVARFVELMIGTGKHVVVLGHMREDTLPSQAKHIRPAASSTLTANIGAMMDAILFLEFNGTNRTLTTASDPSLLTKSRFGGLTKISNPEWSHIEALMKSLQKDKDNND